MIDFYKIQNCWHEFHTNTPFKHCVIDDFLNQDLAKQIDNDFLPYDSNVWVEYTNPTQIKKMYNDWYYFPKSVYNLFAYLNSHEFVQQLSEFVGSRLYIDPGLYSGGCHIHGVNGILDPHLDYNLHPKLPYFRKLNLIIYLSENYQTEFGGLLELWEGQDFLVKKVKQIEPFFNRAVLFDTTQNSWHSVSPFAKDGAFRKSLAIYYLTDPDYSVNDITVRNTSLFTK
jgi:Rps23 Pro-64 3,4-dihydroxylase Tpa1-like proline 4-hydroxylase